MVKYIHQEDNKNIAKTLRERVDTEEIFTYFAVCWRRSRVRRAKCMASRPKYRPLHTLGIYLRIWKVFCKILTAGKRTFFPRELDKTGSIYSKIAIVYQVQRVLI
jgi:hypothetical protein